MISNFNDNNNLIQYICFKQDSMLQKYLYYTLFLNLYCEHRFHLTFSRVSLSDISRKSSYISNTLKAKRLYHNFFAKDMKELNEHCCLYTLININIPRFLSSFLNNFIFAVSCENAGGNRWCYLLLSRC